MDGLPGEGKVPQPGASDGARAVDVWTGTSEANSCLDSDFDGASCFATSYIPRSSSVDSIDNPAAAVLSSDRSPPDNLIIRRKSLAESADDSAAS